MDQTSKVETIVKINVGGKPFYTEQETMLKSQYFKTLLAESMQKRVYVGKNSDEIFIDRSGEIFRHVLQYLRLGKVFVKDENTLKKLKIEASYYGLSDLENKVEERTKYLLERKDRYIFMEIDKLLERCMGGCFKFRPKRTKSQNHYN